MGLVYSVVLIVPSERLRVVSRKFVCVSEMSHVSLIVGWNLSKLSMNVLRLSRPWHQIMNMSSM